MFGNPAKTGGTEHGGMKSRLLCLLLAAAVSGCAGVPAPRKAAADAAVTAIPQVPASQSATVKAGLSIERWWTLLGDAGLEGLLDEALARNADLEAAVARVREAQASLDLVAAGQVPSVDLQARRTRQRVSGAEGFSNRLSIDAAYEVDLWGKLSSATAAARQQLLATEWARSAIEWSLTAALAEAYFGLAAVDRQIEISQTVRTLRQATVELRQKEYAVGAGNEFELRRAQAELTAVEASIASLGRSRASLERAVTALLGRTPQEIAAGRIRRNALDEARSFAALLPQGPSGELLVRRPDIRQAEAELAAANYSIESARAATLPSVVLMGSLGSDSRSVADLFSAPAAIWSIGASITKALVDGGKGEARVRQEHARAEQALAAYRKTVAGAVLDVQEAYAVLDLTQRELEAERERVAALARARELARRGYAAGALSYLDLLDAERNWYQAQLDHVAAYRDQLVGQVAAFKALGGGHS
jgi:outer membrane protein, multidrug efflux system